MGALKRQLASGKQTKLGIPTFLSQIGWAALGLPLTALLWAVTGILKVPLAVMFHDTISAFPFYVRGH